jgi:hypothetical protein
MEAYRRMPMCLTHCHIDAVAFIFGILAVICKSERREAATKMVIVFAIYGLLLIGHYFTKGSQEGRAELTKAAYNFPEKIKELK